MGLAARAELCSRLPEVARLLEAATAQRKCWAVLLELGDARGAFWSDGEVWRTAGAAELRWLAGEDDTVAAEPKKRTKALNLNLTSWEARLGRN